MVNLDYLRESELGISADDTLKIFKYGAHSLQLECPEDFNKSLLDFAKQVFDCQKRYDLT